MLHTSGPTNDDEDTGDEHETNDGECNVNYQFHEDDDEDTEEILCYEIEMKPEEETVAYLSDPELSKSGKVIWDCGATDSMSRIRTTVRIRYPNSFFLGILLLTTIISTI